VVSAVSPTITTTASSAITLGTTAPILRDSAVLAKGYYETGSMVFTLTGPGGFSYTQSDPLSGNATYTASDTLPTTGSVAGNYTWHVSYAGDANNNSALDQGGTAEQTVVSAASPTITTTASSAVTLGTTAPTLSDSAVLAKGYYETGSMVFTLTGPGGFSYTQSDPLSGNGTYSASDTLPTTGTVAGTYTWHVSFAGNANNNSAVDQGGTGEQTVVSAASPMIAASPGAPVVLGTGIKLTASATISSGYYETGAITFKLYDPNSNLVDTETVAVSGNGTYTTPSGYVPTSVGTYQWVASYGGDSNNHGASTTKGSVPEIGVGAGATTVASSLYLVGGNTNDTLNISPTGTSLTGSTGIIVNGQLNNSNINNQTYTQVFTTIYVVGFGGNDNFTFASTLTIATVISDGNGNDTIQAGNGNNTITLGNGNDNVTLGGGSNTVTAGAVGSTGTIQVQLGNGNNNSVTLLGNGSDKVQVGNGNNDSVTISGNGNDQVLVGNGNNDFVSIVGNGNESVQTGTGTGTAHVAGTGSETIHLGSGWIRI
jgi:hypothetical protein